MKMKKPKTPPPLEVVYLDPATNETIVLEGRIIPNILHNNAGNRNSVSPLSMSTVQSTSPVQQANAMGPMLYVLSVIIVYGLSMFLLVGTLARRKSYHKQLDVEVGRYIKGLRAAREEAKKTDVQRLRLNWPGNFIMFQKNTSDNDGGSCHTSDSEGECYPAISKPVEISSSDESSYIELPATTVSIMTETNDNTGDLYKSIMTSREIVNEPLINNNNFTDKKEVRFSEGNLESTKLGHSQFSLREPVCLSNEHLNEVLPNKDISDKENAPNLHMPWLKDKQEDILDNNDKNAQTTSQEFIIPNNSDVNFKLNDSDNQSEKPVQDSNALKIKKTKKRLRPNRSRELSSTEDIEVDPVMEAYHRSSAYRDRNRRRQSHMTDALQTTSLNHLALPSMETLSPPIEIPLAAIHLLGLPKSDMDMDSASDDPCLEEYRRSKLYKSRYRGKRSGLLDPRDRRVSSSSAEGSPLIPTTRKIQQRHSAADRPNMTSLTQAKQLSTPPVAIKVTSPDNVVAEVCHEDTKY